MKRKKKYFDIEFDEIKLKINHLKSSETNHQNEDGLEHQASVTL